MATFKVDETGDTGKVATEDKEDVVLLQQVEGWPLEDFVGQVLTLAFSTYEVTGTLYERDTTKGTFELRDLTRPNQRQ
jgi:hypothetical protein